MRTLPAQSEGVPTRLVDEFPNLLEVEDPFLRHIQTAIEELDKRDWPMALELYTPTAEDEVAALVHANNIQHVNAPSVGIYSHAREHSCVISIVNPLY